MLSFIIHLLSSFPLLFVSTHNHLITECCCYGAFVCRRRFKWCGSRAEVDAEIAEDQQAAGGRNKKGEGRGEEGIEEEEEDRSRWRREHQQREMATRGARLQPNA